MAAIYLTLHYVYIHLSISDVAIAIKNSYTKIMDLVITVAVFIKLGHHYNSNSKIQCLK